MRREGQPHCAQNILPTPRGGRRGAASPLRAAARPSLRRHLFICAGEAGAFPHTALVTLRAERGEKVAAWGGGGARCAERRRWRRALRRTHTTAGRRMTFLERGEWWEPRRFGAGWLAGCGRGGCAQGIAEQPRDRRRRVFGGMVRSGRGACRGGRLVQFAGFRGTAAAASSFKNF